MEQQTMYKVHTPIFCIIDNYSKIYETGKGPVIQAT